MPTLTAVASNPAPGTNEPKPRTTAQAEASRANGARSRGPVTEAGRRRSSQNAVRHGLRSKAPVLAPDDARHLTALRADLLRRWPVATPVERHWLERLAACHLRLEKLEEIEFLAMDALLFDTDEPEARRLPSLATLLRYRKQIGREMEEAGRNLQTLIEGRLHRTGGSDESEAWEEDADACTDEPAPGLDFPDPVSRCRARHREQPRFDACKRD